MKKSPAGPGRGQSCFFFSPDKNIKKTKDIHADQIPDSKSDDSVGELHPPYQAQINPLGYDVNITGDPFM